MTDAPEGFVNGTEKLDRLLERQAARRPGFTPATVGRIVHYQPKDYLDQRDGQPNAAIVTAVCDEEGRAVRLRIFSPDFDDLIPEYGPIYVYSEEPREGCWNWPPR